MPFRSTELENERKQKNCFWLKIYIQDEEWEHKIKI